MHRKCMTTCIKEVNNKTRKLERDSRQFLCCWSTVFVSYDVAMVVIVPAVLVVDLSG